MLDFDSCTQEQTEELPELANDGLSEWERQQINSTPSDPIHRVLFDFHPELYRNYRLVVRELERAKHDLWRVESALKSGRLSPEERAALKIRRSELRMQVAERENARAYKITHLLEAESVRIRPNTDNKVRLIVPMVSKLLSELL